MPTGLVLLIILAAAVWLWQNSSTAGPLPGLPATPARPAPASQPTASPAAADAALARYLPDPRLTPGDVLDVGVSDICVTGYSQKVRDVPLAVKEEVYREYGIASHQPGAYEVDHLISLELGGSNSVRNLWPESYSGEWNAHTKDALEDRLHSEVCAGKLDLKTAQREISSNWIAAYRKYVKP